MSKSTLPPQPKDSADDLINVDDFKSLKLDIAIENQTSHVTIYENRRIFPKGKDEVIEEGHFPVVMFQVLEKGFILELPARACSVGHVLKIFIETRNLPVNKKYTFIARVKALQDDRDNPSKKSDATTRQQFELELTNFDPELWQAFQNIFESKQAEITEFFESAKGS